MGRDNIDESTSLAKRNLLELLCFKLLKNGVIFAINVFKVRETVKFTDLTELPGVDEAIEGLLILRDEIIPVVDLKKWLYGSKDPIALKDKGIEPDDSERQIMICEFNQTIIGIKIYKAEYIIRKSWNEIMVPIAESVGAKRKISNYTKNDAGEIVHIVDVEQMLSDKFPELDRKIENEVQYVQSFEVDEEKIVLIAEDSKVALKSLANVLNKLGVKFRSFENGQLLLDYMDKRGGEVGNIGLIITDLEMPVASGFTVIKTLKENSKTAHIPIIVNSSMSGKSNQDMARDLNADGFMPKTKPGEIAGFIKEFLGKESIEMLADSSQ